MPDDTQGEPATAFAEELSEAADDFAKSMLTESNASEPLSDGVGSQPYGSSGILSSLPLALQVVVGSARMTIGELQKMRQGSVIQLDRCVGETAELKINGRVVALGEVVLIDEASERFGFRITALGSTGQDQ